MSTDRKFSGTTWASLKKYPELFPVWACIIGGGCLASYYLFRLATRNPDVSWAKSKNPEPWQAYEAKQYKYLNPLDREPGSPAPKY